MKNVCLGVILTSPLREEKIRLAPKKGIYDTEFFWRSLLLGDKGFQELKLLQVQNHFYATVVNSGSRQCKLLNSHIASEEEKQN